MTIAEAQAEAEKRWGSSAYATPVVWHHACPELDISGRMPDTFEVGVFHGSDRWTKGSGASFEEAFEAADEIERVIA